MESNKKMDACEVEKVRDAAAAIPPEPFFDAIRGGDEARLAQLLAAAKVPVRLNAIKEAGELVLTCTRGAAPATATRPLSHRPPGGYAALDYRSTARPLPVRWRQICETEEAVVGQASDPMHGCMLTGLLTCSSHLRMWCLWLIT